MTELDEAKVRAKGQIVWAGMDAIPSDIEELFIQGFVARARQDHAERQAKCDNLQGTLDDLMMSYNVLADQRDALEARIKAIEGCNANRPCDMGAVCIGCQPRACPEAQPSAVQVPDEMVSRFVPLGEYAHGWKACRAAMLAAPQPAQEVAK